MTSQAPSQKAPEQLYHTVLTVIDYHEDSSGATRSVYVLGTHCTLDAATTYALQSLEKLSFTPREFQDYEVRLTDGGRWKHGDDVLVFACAPSGQVFLVGIETTPNDNLLAGRCDGEIVLPKGARTLYYVLHTTADYTVGCLGSAQITRVIGSYGYRAEAQAAARKCLDPQQFFEYSIKEDEATMEQWPFDQDVIIFALTDTGQAHYVAVKTLPWVNAEKTEETDTY
ncbi:hypothetical protein G3M48_008552 [Beauveria asiatica]|uniref:Uncharacterized protein n=1 Tax=Beauveria asiatica TaxID=1069075 RepID=A0AAW0RKK6_9HYPO